jgi:hypothetical protein
MEDMLEQVFNDAYDDVYEHFSARKREDPAFDKTALQGFLDSQYHNQGNNWEGRSEIKEQMLNATIAAAETILAEWDS